MFRARRGGCAPWRREGVGSLQAAPPFPFLIRKGDATFTQLQGRRGWAWAGPGLGPGLETAVWLCSAGDLVFSSWL